MIKNDPAIALQSLLGIMRRLRAPDGCPWDANQTPQSLAPYILEEACELIDAIESDDTERVLDELGDLLLQVVFQARIFEERQLFAFSDIAQTIAEKLVRRHPHVFEPDGGEQKVDLDRQWESIKQSEAVSAKSCLADHLPSRLPSLQNAQKLLVKSARRGDTDKLPVMAPTDWAKIIAPVGDDLTSGLNEEKLGLALFQLTRLADQAGLDAETALRKFLRKTIQLIEP